MLLILNINYFNFHFLNQIDKYILYNIIFNTYYSILIFKNKLILNINIYIF